MSGSTDYLVTALERNAAAMAKAAAERAQRSKDRVWKQVSHQGKKSGSPRPKHIPRPLGTPKWKQVGLLFADRGEMKTADAAAILAWETRNVSHYLSQFRRFCDLHQIRYRDARRIGSCGRDSGGFRLLEPDKARGLLLK